METKEHKNRKYSKTSSDITFIYLVFCLIWFIGLDRLALHFSSDMETLARIELYMDLGFAVVTSILLYTLIHGSIVALREREFKISRLNRVYAMLSGINGAILRIRDKQKLLEEACKIAAQGDIYQAIGIRLVDFKNNTVFSAASAGVSKNYINETKTALSKNDKFGLGPTGTALREGRTVVINDISKDIHGDPWRHQATAYDIKACAAFPLIVKDKVIGAISLYAKEVDTFDEEELNLLNEIAADTSLGLEYIEKESDLDYLYNYDVVTGLPNLLLFADHLSQSISRYGYHNSRCTAVASISIENYRRIINSFGLHTGDRVLREVASHFSDTLRSGDFVAKTGHHDFSILLVDLANERDVSTVAHKIFSSLPQMIHINNDSITLNYRAGIAIHPRDSEDPDELIRYAGHALSAARDQKVSLNFFSKQLEDQFEKLRIIEQELQVAVEHNELIHFYQPIISTATKKIVSAEALLRWNSPRLGAVSPVDFIPVAEESGLIMPIGYWALKETARQVKDWEEKNLNIRLAINISPYQLRQKGFLDHIINVMKQTGIDLSKNVLTIEITESALIESFDKILPEFNKLKAAGVGISVDDFGTGYSSLSYLRKLPVDILKIDKEFINGIPQIKESVTLVKGIIGMARGLGLKVIAEGVETEEQFAILEEYECDFIQGYLFSKAVPADELLKMISPS